MSGAPLCRLSLTACLIAAVFPGLPAHSQLLSYEGFENYGGGTQLESGGNGSGGIGLDGGSGWGAAYNVSNAIKSLVKIEDRTVSPVNYTNGEITIPGGTRALRFYDIANGTYAVQRPLATGVQAAAGETLWFSVLFRTSNTSPLTNQDFFQLGFDDNADPASGNPRVSIGANTTSASFPSPFQFFARSTTSVNTSAFHGGLSIAAATTYLLVGSIQPHAGSFDTVNLYVNPSTLDDPGSASASVTLTSGLSSLSHLFIRTVGLDNGDAYVIDELRIGRDYASVVLPFSLRDSLEAVPAPTPDHLFILRWPSTTTGARLETSATLAVDSWTEIPGPFPIEGGSFQYAVRYVPGIMRGFFRLRR